MKTKQFENAMIFYMKSIKIPKNSKNLHLEAVALTELAEIYFIQNNYEKADKYVEEAKNIFIKTNKSSHEVNTISAKINDALGDTEKAINDALIAEQKANENKDLDFILQTSRLLTSLHEKKGDIKTANSYLKKVLFLQDNIINSKKNNKIEKIELKLKLQKQEAELKRLQQKNDYLFIIYILGSIGIFLLVLLIFRQVKITRMTKSIHNIQNTLIKDELDKRKNMRISFFKATKKEDQSFLKKQSH